MCYDALSIIQGRGAQMINTEMTLLLVTSLSIGFFHTLMGPDHYLPFIMLSRAQKWSYPKTMAITVLCGIGHVLSSVFIGLIGIAAGVAISRIEGLEGIRGDIAAYILLGFGLAYMAWGIRRGSKDKINGHSHSHAHSSGKAGIKKEKSTVWWLFIIFVLGPCEPLIPILMYPAAKLSSIGLIMVTLVFSLVTIVTMAVTVTLGYFGLKKMRFRFFERFAHALGGAMIALSGVGIIFLGL